MSSVTGQVATQSANAGEWVYSHTCWKITYYDSLSVYGPGGPISIATTPLGPAYDALHGEEFRMYDSNGAINPNKIANGEYTIGVSSTITGFYLCYFLPNYVVGNLNNVVLTAHTRYPAPSFSDWSGTLVIKVTSSQIILTGTNVHFHYDNWNVAIQWNNHNPLYGHNSLNFVMTMDK
jgi:hypothetical protein